MEVLSQKEEAHNTGQNSEHENQFLENSGSKVHTLNNADMPILSLCDEPSNNNKGKIIIIIIYFWFWPQGRDSINLNKIKLKVNLILKLFSCLSEKK